MILNIRIDQNIVIKWSVIHTECVLCKINWTAVLDLI